MSNPSRCHRYLIAGLLLASLGFAAGRTVGSQAVPNPSFEADTFVVGPGYASANGGAISGWSISNAARIGLNPAVGNAMADNGAVPDGTNVAFVEPGGTLSTTITGLIVGKAYRVRFRANQRSSGDMPVASWSLNGEPFVGFNASPAVGGSNAYYEVTGSFVATAVTAGLAVRNRSPWDSALLVDDFTINQQDLLMVLNANDAGAGSLRQAIRDAGSEGLIQFAPSFPGVPISTASELTADRWQVSAWTGDGDSGISSSLTYTHAYNLGSAVAAVVNDVTFAGVAGVSPSAGDFSLVGTDSLIPNDPNTISAQVEGGSRVLANDLVFNGAPATLTLSGLTAGRAYRATVFGVGFDPPGSRIQTFSSSGLNVTVDEGAYGDNEGVRIELDYIATAASQVITVTPQAVNTFHFYAIANAELPKKDITIDATSLADGVTVSGGGSHRAFRVARGDSLTLKKLTIVDGATAAGEDGGALYNYGTLNLRDARIANNTADRYGGGIYNASGRVLNISNTGLVGNMSVLGGAICSFGPVSIQAASISGNSSSAIYSTVSLIMSRSTISGNTSTTLAAGLWNRGDARLTNTTIVGNQAGQDGGGIHHGGAGEMVLAHCTVTGNSSDGSGGGLGAEQPVTLSNSIVAENSAVVGSADMLGPAAAGSGGNLIGDGTGLTGIANGVDGNQIGGGGSPVIPAGLAPLGNYGGGTQTRALEIGSLAIDAGNATSVATDQRGKSRVLDGDTVAGAFPDIGAFEFSRHVVTSTADAGPGSLRAALEGMDSGDLVLFNAGVLPGTVFNGSPTSTIKLTAPIAIADSAMVIDASANFGRVTLDAGGAAQILTVDASSTVRIDSVSFVNGDAGAAGDGGAIHNEGNLTVSDAQFLHNRAGHYGGAIYNGYNATLELDTCTLMDNRAPFAGGILNFGVATLASSTVARNSEIGIYSSNALGLSNCTVAENSAADDNAGGIYNPVGSLSLTHCTVSWNSSAFGAGGISTSVEALLTNTLVAGNRSTEANDINGPVAASSAGNIIGDGTLMTGVTDGVAGNLIGTGIAPFDVRLAPLGYYGGPTPTMAPLLDSPVIDAAQGSTVTPDQRGFPRVGAADVGAVEAGPVAVVTNADDDGPGSLRQVLLAASAPGTRILFNLTAATSEIALSTGQLALAVDQTVFLDASRLVDGAGIATAEPTGVSVTAGDASRVFEVPYSASVALQNMTLGEGLNGAGGGLVWCEGEAMLIDSTLHGGDALAGRGGAIYGGAASRIALHRSTCYDNRALEGGAVFAQGGLRIASSTLTQNFGNFGGAVQCRGPSAFLHSTLSANSADDGGGIYNNNTVARMENCIVAGNVAPSGTDVTNENAVLDLAGANLIGGVRNFSGGTVIGSAALSSDPLLDALADNGGPTLTMAPRSSSPARDAGSIGAVVPFTDQRGFPRQLGAGMDVGAYEAAAGDFTPLGLTLFSAVPKALAELGTMGFAISPDPEFVPQAATLAGLGTVGLTDDAALAAEFSYPSDVACDSLGFLFVADSGNNVIRMVSPDGDVTTVAGTGDFGFVDGDGDEARFAFPSGIAVGPDDAVYVADSLNHRIRKLTRPLAAGQEWEVSTAAGFGVAGFQDGSHEAARFDHPQGIACDAFGNLYVADTENHRVRKVTPAGQVTTLAGTGSAGSADGLRLASRFSSPLGVAVDGGGSVFVADSGNHRIRKIGLTSVTTIAGEAAGFLDAAGTGAQFRTPSAVATDAAGNLWVADRGNHAIRTLERPLNPSGTWLVATLGGTGAAGYGDGRATDAQFRNPTGLCIGADRSVVIADQQNHRLRRVFDAALVDAVAGATDPLGRAISAGLDVASLGLLPETTYYFRWVAANGREQRSGQAFRILSSPFVSWQVSQFGAAAADPLVSDPLANPSGDEISNLMKYALGLDSMTASQEGLPTVEESAGLLSIRYNRSTDLSDLDYVVEWSTNLLDWNSTGVTEQVVGGSGSTEEVLASVPLQVGMRQFIRLNLVLRDR